MFTPTREVTSGLQKPSIAALSQSSRGLKSAGAIVALAAAWGLTGCGLVTQPGEAPVLEQQAKTELRTRIDDGQELIVAGERLNAVLLQRFYARHGFEPVWTTRPTQETSLVGAVLRAGDQGLEPDMFHADLLRHLTTLPSLDRELLLSDAFLSYSDALARGAVPVERRSNDEVLTPEPIDVAARLDVAIDSPDPGASLEALAPTTPTYVALRQALRSERLDAKGHGKIATGRLRTIEVNLERQRWLPRALPTNRAWVNVANQQLMLYRADQPIYTTRVVVGEDVRRNQTPEFDATIDAVFFDPPWVIPSDIVTREILPDIRHDPNYLARNNMIMLAGGEAEQLPGPTAGLGLLMFDMPNRFDVFLHDTPDRYIFSRENRRISHGCIRVQDPRDLAALLLQQPIDRIDQGIAVGSTTRHHLPTPVPVFVVYETAFLGAGGTLEFDPDFYHRDPEIWRQLEGRSEGQHHLIQADSSQTLRPLRS